MRVCELCGANLDPGEKCDCQENELPIIPARYACAKIKKEKEKEKCANLKAASY